MHFLQPNTSKPIMSQTKRRHAPGTVFTIIGHQILMQVLMLLAIRTHWTNIRALLQIFVLWSKSYRYDFTSLTGKPASEIPFFGTRPINDSILPVKAMVSMHLALEVHLNGRSIQAYLLGDVVVYLFLVRWDSITKCMTSPTSALKSQPGMILPSTKICGTVWAAKNEGVWIKLDSLQTMDPTSDLSWFIMKGISTHQLENKCWDTLEAKLSHDLSKSKLHPDFHLQLKLLDTLSSVIPFRVFMNSSSSERWSASTTWWENETTKLEIH